VLESAGSPVLPELVPVVVEPSSGSMPVSGEDVAVVEPSIAPVSVEVSPESGVSPPPAWHAVSNKNE
jgi:ABC-type thiamine transport system ATPase subunit